MRMGDSRTMQGIRGDGIVFSQAPSARDAEDTETGVGYKSQSDDQSSEESTSEGDSDFDLNDPDVAIEFFEVGCECFYSDIPQDSDHARKVVEQELIARRTSWVGKFWMDYIFHIANNHPLLGCIFCSPAHPYSKCERLGVLYIVSCLTMSPAVIIQTALKGRKHGGIIATLMTLGGVTIPMMLVEVILVHIATLDIVFQHRHGFRCYEKCCKKGSQCVHIIEFVFFGVGIMTASLVALIVIFVQMANDQEDDSIHVALTWCGSRMQAWIIWLFTDFFMPCCGFWSRWKTDDKVRRQEFREAKKKKAEEAGEQLEEDGSESDVDVPTKKENARRTRAAGMASFCSALVILTIFGIGYLWFMVVHPAMVAKMHNKVKAIV